MTDFSQDLVERVMLEASFKLSREQREIFLRMQHQMTRLSSFVPGDPIPQDFVEAAEAVQAVMYEIVEQRRAKDRKSNTSELQSLMRISYAVFCLKKKTRRLINTDRNRKHIN